MFGTQIRIGSRMLDCIHIFRSCALLPSGPDRAQRQQSKLITPKLSLLHSWCQIDSFTLLVSNWLFCTLGVKLVRCQIDSGAKLVAVPKWCRCQIVPNWGVMNVAFCKGGGECRGWWMSGVVNVGGDECRNLHWGWWTSGVVNVGGDECRILHWGWWMSGVVNVGVVNVAQSPIPFRNIFRTKKLEKTQISKQFILCQIGRGYILRIFIYF